jgi:peroxiredoxin (alkyl hydroperoxide reductase subunit C)
MPLIGDRAPKFTAQTTNGTVIFPDDYIGHWTVLFSHPMDFTPVCTTEFLSFQSQIQEFEKLNTKIIGLSVGAIPSHLAWFQSIYQDIDFKGIKNVEITFPVIADLDLKVSRLYGMIHPNTSDTKTVRAVFIIDNTGIIRTILYYPQTIGRNIQEILRILTALQTNDAFGLSIPSDWTPGESVIEPSPATAHDLRKHTKKQQTWYLTFRDLSKSEIYKKLNKTQK